MTKLNIVIDVDITLVDSATPWLSWLHSNSKVFESTRYCNDLTEGGIDYKLSNYFKMNNQIDGMDFWKKPDLYDNLQCYNEAIGVVKYLYQQGHTITFASFCFPQHENSKVNMLKREFDFIKPEDFHFVSTKSKGRLKADVIIDDRNVFLNQFDGGTLKIRLETPYVQCVQSCNSTMVADSWSVVNALITTKLDDDYMDIIAERQYHL